ncbi:MAG TPA: aminotransferase class I/II-fold pyridoxal phosphate-dependent enzyme, partial [Longimicrobiales bacterium]
AGDEIAAYHAVMKKDVEARLDRLYQGLMAMKARGLPVDAFPPEGAIYLSARFDLNGRTVAGRALRTNEDVRRYLLQEAGFAAVAFQAFGVQEDTGWFRLSVGAVSMPQIEEVLPRLEEAVAKVE